jgi:hypothetical protein
MFLTDFFWRLKWFIILLLMFLLDFSPIPASASVFVYVFIFKPRWFKDIVDRLYRGAP